MSQTKFESGISGGLVFIRLQAANTYQTPGEIPLAANAMSVREIEWEWDRPQKPRADQNRTMAKQGSIRGMAQGTFRMLADPIPSGNVANEWDGQLLFLTGIFDDAVTTPTATTVSGAGSTVQIIDVTSAAAIAVGDTVGFTDTNGNVWGRRVTAVDTAATPDNITIECPLTFTPATGSAVTASKSYALSNTAEDTAFTLWHKMTHGGVRLGGCVINSYKFVWGNNDSPMLEVAGFFREFGQGRPSTLDGGIDNSQTTMDVASTDWKGITEGAILTIEAEGANTAEAVYVNAAVTSATLTIERNKDGVGASAHAGSAVVVVYEPTPTLAGNPLPSDGAEVDVNLVDAAASSQLESESGSLELVGGVKERVRGHGDPYAIQGYIKSSDLSASLSISTWAEKITWDYFYRHYSADERPCVVQFGTTAGAIFVINLARQVFDDPKIRGNSDDHVAATLDSTSRGSRTGTSIASIATL